MHDDTLVNTLTCMSDSGIGDYNLVRHEKARELLDQMFLTINALFSDEHLETLVFMANLAFVYLKQNM